MTPDDVPPGPLLVDTDVFSWVRGSHERGDAFLPFLRNRTLAISFATVAELRFGALHAKWGATRRASLEDGIRRHVVLAATDAVSTAWAEINARCRDQLGGGGVNDMWIAACALAQPTPPWIATGNLRDFQTIVAAFPALHVAHPDL